jgi:spermidine/putrescine ABC transporter ATP-binding subunit
MSTGNDKELSDPSQKGIADATAAAATASPSQRRQSNPSGSGRADPSHTEPTAVALAKVSKRFAGIIALDDASITVRRGELMTLLGPSGCGKTTLLYLIAGFLAADNGMVEIEGERVNEVPTYRRQTGIVFQSYALFPHMTVADNIGYGLRMRRLPKAEIARRVGEALRLVKLDGVEDRRPSQLSGGQQQRVALARALVIRPKVLLLDEPFSALDKALRSSMQLEIKDIQKKLGLTTIFVTHDQAEALSLSDRLAVMSQGCIRQVGTPEEIYRLPADRFVASFIGDVNVLRARLEAVTTWGTVSVGAAQLKVPIEQLASTRVGDAVDAFVRPQQLAFAKDGEPVALTGTIVAQVYQGDHIDLYLDAGSAAEGRVLVRIPVHPQPTSFAVGAAVGLTFSSKHAIAFPSNASNSAMPIAGTPTSSPIRQPILGLPSQ